MLRSLIRMLRVHGKPEVLYLDNGSTYRGEVLRTGHHGGTCAAMMAIAGLVPPYAT